MIDYRYSSRQGENGSALVYILIAIALLAALTVAFMEPSSQQTGSQNAFKAISEIQSQVSFIRSGIQECVLVYPGGDGKAITDGAQLNQPYPIMPDDTYFDDCASDGADLTDEVGLLRCPGNNPCRTSDCTATPDDEACHAQMFGGTSGKFMPPAVAMFEDWRYYAGDDGVFFWTETTRTDAFLDTVLEKLNDEYGLCEVDVIDASGGDVDLDSNTTLVCPDGSKCFRVWMRATGTATYQAGSEEDGVCP